MVIARVNSWENLKKNPKNGEKKMFLKSAKNVFIW